METTVDEAVAVDDHGFEHGRGDGRGSHRCPNVDGRAVGLAEDDDEVLIRTFVTEALTRAMTFGYELRDGTGERLHATGYSKHVWVDRESRRPTMADAEVMQAFQPYLPEQA